MKTLSFPHFGLYAITQTEQKSTQKIIEDVKAVLDGGAAVVQYRNKTLMDLTQEIDLASELLSLCHNYHCPLIVNDNVSLAQKIGADGVHLGADDELLENARVSLGENSIIGISCYNDFEKAFVAQNRGANYVAFGRSFPSSSKPLARSADVTVLNKAKTHLVNPIVAIGGILPCNGAELLNAGANLLAVIGGLFNDSNPKAKASDYCALWNNVRKNV